MLDLILWRLFDLVRGNESDYRIKEIIIKQLSLLGINRTYVIRDNLRFHLCSRMPRNCTSSTFDSNTNIDMIELDCTVLHTLNRLTYEFGGVLKYRIKT